ncbi:MAG TPA: DUF4328 domain-containing protein [Phenylobacterium sp.]
MLLWIYAAAEVIFFILEFMRLAALGQAESDMGANLYFQTYGADAEVLLGLFSILYLLTYAMAGIVTLKWIYRINLNAKALAPDKQVSPVWAVGWYFIPFASLFMPFKAMRETWQISRSPDTWREEPVPALLRWWWGLYIASSSISLASSRLDMAAATVGDMALASLLTLLATPLTLALCLVLMRIVRRISETQTAKLPGATSSAEIVALAEVSG